MVVVRLKNQNLRVSITTYSEISGTLLEITIKIKIKIKIKPEPIQESDAVDNNVDLVPGAALFHQHRVGEIVALHPRARLPFLDARLHVSLPHPCGRGCDTYGDTYMRTARGVGHSVWAREAAGGRSGRCDRRPGRAQATAAERWGWWRRAGYSCHAWT